MNAFADSWPFGLIGCRVFYLLDYVGMTVGVYSVAALSFERLLVVTDNKKSLDKLSDKFKKFIVLIYLTLIWSIGILFSLPLLFHIEFGKEIDDDKYSCGLYIDDSKYFILLSIRFVLIFLLPFTIILISSIKLILYVKKNNSVLKSKRTLISERKKTTIRAKNKRIKQKAIKIVLSIVLMFLIQWLPYRICIYMFFKIISIKYVNHITIITTIISFTNSFSNPLLYIFLTNKFSMIQNLRRRINSFLQKN